MAHFMQSGHGGCVTQLPYKDSLNHPIFKHYNPSVGAWATGQLIQAWVPKLKVDVGFPVDGAESMPHASGMDMDVRRQQQADRDRMENDRQVYMHTLKREQDMVALQQQLAAQQQQQGDNGGDNYQNDDDDGQEQPPSRRRTAKKAVRRVVRFARDNESDESSGEEDVDEGVEPVRNAKRTVGRKVRSPRNRLGDQLSSSTAKTSSSKKKSSPY